MPNKRIDLPTRGFLAATTAPRGWLDSNGSAIRRWWFFWNHESLSLFMGGIVGLPFAALLMWYLVDPHAKFQFPAIVYKEIGFLLINWLALIFVARTVLPKHMYRFLSVKLTDAGVDLKNRFLQKSISWAQIKRIVSTRQGQYLISTADGAYYFPADQQWSKSVAEHIRQKASAGDEKYALVMSLDSRQKTQANFVALQFFFMMMAQWFGPFFHDKPTTLNFVLTEIVAWLPWTIVCAVIYFLTVFKTPDLFLIGETITVVDRSGEHTVRLDEVNKVWMIAKLAFVSTAKGNWFVPMTSVVDQNTPRNLGLVERWKARRAASKEAKIALLALRRK